MIEEKNIVKAIRMDAETLEKFKALCGEFTNQGECMQQLISVYELNQAKGVLTNQESNVANFQAHLDGILQGYLHSLELNENAENRIRMEFSQQLASKDKTIADLQKRLEEEKASCSLANDIKEKTVKALEELQTTHENSVTTFTEKLANAEKEVETLNATIADKETIIDSLNYQLTTLTSQIENAKNIQGNYSVLQKKLSDVQNENSKLKEQSKLAEEKLVEQKVKADEQLKLSQERAEVEVQRATVLECSKHQGRISELMEQVQTLIQRNGELVSTIADLNTQIAHLQLSIKDKQ